MSRTLMAVFIFIDYSIRFVSVPPSRVFDLYSIFWQIAIILLLYNPARIQAS